MIRKASAEDIPSVSAIYDELHTAEEEGGLSIGWERGVYPTEITARNACDNGELFVEEDEGVIVGAAIINQKQVDAYEGASWEYPAENSDVMVLHTLVISPEASGKGYGRAFVEFYEDYALAKGCHSLRMDTNARNSHARAMYSHLGYKEIGIVPTVFNGIAGVELVLLEKHLDDADADYIRSEVHELYYGYDENCARTSLRILSHLFGMKVENQTLKAARGLHGAGLYRAQCGIVEGTLMFIGIIAESREDAVALSHDFAAAFEKRFGSLRCRELRPAGFRPDDPPHLCETLTVMALIFSYRFIRNRLG